MTAAANIVACVIFNISRVVAVTRTRTIEKIAVVAAFVFVFSITAHNGAPVRVSPSIPESTFGRSLSLRGVAVLSLPGARLDI